MLSRVVWIFINFYLSEDPKFHKVPFSPPTTSDFPRRELKKVAGVLEVGRDFIALVTLRVLIEHMLLKYED
jgi:hypothetical protein